MKKIGVLSDTHIPKNALNLPKEVYKAFEKVDLILHAGDFVEIEFFNKLNTIAPVRAVAGNMDSPELREMLPEKDVVEIDGFKIGLIHGYGPRTKVLDLIKKEFGRVDAIVFGHTHFPINETENGVLFLNPGSPTDKIFALYNSYGIIEVGDSLKGSIIKL